MKHKIIIVKTEDLIRVDLFVVNYLKDFSRSQVKKMFNDNLIKVNEEFVKPSYILKMDDCIEVTVDDKDKVIKPINLNIEIIYEDEQLLVLNKPAGLIVHPSETSDEVSLVNHLLFHTDKLALKNGEDRPGIVHRIDKDTSGLLLVAKTDFAYDNLAKQFQQRTVKRNYLAIVNNPFKEDSGTIKAPILRDKFKMTVSSLGKEAITHFKVIRQNEEYSYLKCSLETGRTHQIRVHLAYINHPIVADDTYGNKKAFKNFRQALHAYELGFVHPVTEQILNFRKEPPEDFLEILKKVGLDA